MSEAPASSAAPEAGANPDSGYADLAAELRADMRARREAKPQDGAPPSVGDDVDVEGGQQADADPSKKPEEQEPADDVKPHWAKAMKEDLAAAKADVEQFKKNEAEWKQAVAGYRIAAEDVKDEAAHFKGLFDQAMAYLEKIGHPITKESLAVAERDLEIRKMKRRMGATQAQDQGTQRQANVDALSRRIDALIAKHPELDYKKSDAAKKFLAARLRSGSMDGFEDDAMAWLEVQRGKQMRAQQANGKPKPRENLTLGGEQQAPAGRKQGDSKNPFGIVDEKSIKRDLNRRAAAR